MEHMQTIHERRSSRTGSPSRARLRLSDLPGARKIANGWLPSGHSEDEQHNRETSMDLRNAEPNLGLKERLRHFTWAWFTLTMSTGGIANVIYNVPLYYDFRGLYALGVVFMILNLTLSITNIILICLRFYWWPRTLRDSFTHPTESLFVPAFVIGLATDLINITQYGSQVGKTGPWLVTTMTVFYWVYCALALAFCIGILLVIWSTQTFTLAQMTPVWIFPAYPLMLVGPFASVLTNPSTGIGGHAALRVMVSGFIIQGIGFLVSMMIYSSYIYRLMSQKLPTEASRPAMFISVGPAGFTVFTLIHLGDNFPHHVPEGFMGDAYLVGLITKIMGYWAGMWIWGLALWFFFLSLGAHWSCVSHNRLHFAMNWNGFVFPNTALATGTFSVAIALNDNRPIAIVGCVLGVGVLVAWCFIVLMLIRAIIKKQILWPQQQEDRDEGTWRRQLKIKQLQDAHFTPHTPGIFTPRVPSTPVGGPGAAPNTDRDEDLEAAKPGTKRVSLTASQGSMRNSKNHLAPPQSGRSSLSPSRNSSV